MKGGSVAYLMFVSGSSELAARLPPGRRHTRSLLSAGQPQRAGSERPQGGNQQVNTSVHNR